jgi:outer membrane receptor protein involved in Fe transport
MNILLASLILPSVLLGQTTTTFSGRVEASSGAVISGARVTLVRQGTDEMHETASHGDGSFSFEGVSFGSYILRIEMSGFEPYQRTLAVGPQEAKPLTVRLKLAAVEQQMTVEADLADELSTSQNDAATTRIDDSLLRQLPTFSEDLTPLLEKFTSPAAQGAEGLSIIIDGVETSGIDLPVSAIRKMRIDRNPYSALFQHPGKAKVEITTERGNRKRYDGGFTMYARNSVLDARNAFAESKPDLDRKFMLASLGGPLRGESSSFYISAQRSMRSESGIINAVTLTGPLVANAPTALRNDNVFGRLQWWINPLHTLYATFLFHDRTFNNKGVGGKDSNLQGVNGGRHRHTAVLGYSAIMPVNWRNDLRFSFSNDNDGDGSLAAAPAIKVNGAFSEELSQVFTREGKRSFELQDTVFYGHSKHSVTFGGRVRTQQIDAFDASNFGGTFEFGSLGEYAAGNPFVFRVVRGDPNVAFTAHVANGFVQDEVQLTPKLTLTFGLRYDWQSTIDQRSNFAPRFAFAFAPGKSRKTVVRGGTGMFYDNLPTLATERSLLYNGGLRELVISGPSFPNPFLAGQDISPPPSIIRVAPNIRAPYFSQASVGVEHELWNKNWLTVEYSFLHGVHLFRSRNVNAPLPETGKLPDPTFLNINQVESTAFARSQALTVTFNGRLGKFFRPYAQYVFSKTINDTAGTFSLPADNYNLRPEIGPADLDYRHRLNLMGVLALPRALRLGLVLSAVSGPPFDITTGFDDNGDTEANDRPPGVTRNTGRGPGTVQLDLRLTKGFNLPHLWPGEQRARLKRNNLEFSVDAFNALNHTNLGSIVGVQSSPFFGRANSAWQARTLQLSVRYMFRVQ